jgi:hypothetical protein
MPSFPVMFGDLYICYIVPTCLHLLIYFINSCSICSVTPTSDLLVYLIVCPLDRLYNLITKRKSAPPASIHTRWGRTTRTYTCEQVTKQQAETSILCRVERNIADSQPM